jgi:hypothetical protein
MTANVLTLILLAEAIGLAALYLLLKRLSWFTKRTWDEVPEFLRQLDPQVMEKLFDAQEETGTLASGHLRRTRRARLALAREYLDRMQHNATIVYQWAETEWSDMVRHRLQYEPYTRQKIIALHRESITFLVAVRLAQTKIWFWSVLHFDKLKMIPLPSVAGQRRLGSLDLLEAYNQVKQAAAALAGIYGDEQAQEIQVLM